MDSYREHPSEFDHEASDAVAAEDVAMAIGTDERRMHVRAYNYWVSLLDGRDYPSIEDLEPGDVSDFASNSVLLDFTCGRDNPATPYIGAAIREECDLGDEIKSIADVPSRSLLSRLTDHYMQIIANRAPVGFEAEFDNQRGEPICYRGILMPFSSDGDTIDFIYGVINWKQGAKAAILTESAAPVEIATEALIADLPDERGDVPDNDDTLLLETPLADATVEEVATADEPPTFAPLGIALKANGKVKAVLPNDGPANPPAHAFGQPFAREVDFSALPDSGEEEELLELPELGDDAALADRLWAARETAEVVKSADGRSRAALYQALSLAYDFAVAAQVSPEDYAELLEESGMKAQARAPMTPIVKLVFGIDYDKTRLTEFASALSYAQRKQLGLGEFKSFIERQAGGLKALVAAERQAKRPEPKPDLQLEAARQRMRAAPSLQLAEIASEGEFALIVTRRNADGGHEAVAMIEDAAMIERAIRRAA
jgi:hypothetical protein